MWSDYKPSGGKWSLDAYQKLYRESVENPVEFWGEVAKLEWEWIQDWKKVMVENAEVGGGTRWFVEGKVNITQNCLDRHVRDGKGEKLAYVYKNELGEEEKITYRQLLERVGQCANWLVESGVKKGDTVGIYMPTSIEQIVAMLACARIGAIHTVIFAGFSKEAVKQRLLDAGCKVVITSDVSYRRGKIIDLLEVVRKAVAQLEFVERVLVHRRRKTKLLHNELDWKRSCERQKKTVAAVPMDANDPLFILYTSGTTGKPKGVVHGVGGYGVYAHVTTKTTFALSGDEVMWCTADNGWITGHSYLVYGPLSNGVTSLIYEGVPDFPDPEVWWRVIEEYKVSRLYTAPTAIRMLVKMGSEWPGKHELASLEIIGTVGEPINPKVWRWYKKHVGKDRAEVVDTWWQTETGGHMLVTIPGIGQKPGKAGLPSWGVKPVIVDARGRKVRIGKKGLLMIEGSWPGQLIGCWNDQKRFEEYWIKKGKFFVTGDYATKDGDGYVQVLGRSDDIVSVSGHRVGSAEVENALVSHEAVVEAAVVGVPDKVTGEKLAAFVVLGDNKQASVGLAKELQDWVRQEYGAVLSPKEILFRTDVPKTRSGKIMRRVLRAQFLGLPIGDISTLAD